MLAKSFITWPPSINPAAIVFASLAAALWPLADVSNVALFVGVIVRVAGFIEILICRDSIGPMCRDGEMRKTRGESPNSPRFPCFAKVEKVNFF
jgi:hypothetical protein